MQPRYTQHITLMNSPLSQKDLHQSVNPEGDLKIVQAARRKRMRPHNFSTLNNSAASKEKISVGEMEVDELNE